MNMYVAEEGERNVGFSLKKKKKELLRYIFFKHFPVVSFPSFKHIVGD